MKTFVISEGKNEILGQPFFSTLYAVPIFSINAQIRWRRAKTMIADYSLHESYRIIRIKTLSMNLVQDATPTKKPIQTS